MDKHNGAHFLALSVASGNQAVAFVSAWPAALTEAIDGFLSAPGEY